MNQNDDQKKSRATRHAAFSMDDEYLRETFAAAALSGLLARDRDPHAPEALAKLAYAYADAMLTCPARATAPR